MKSLLPLLLSLLFISDSVLHTQQKPDQQIPKISLEDGATRYPIFMANDKEYLEVCDLKKGEVYQVWTVLNGDCEATVGVVGLPAAKSMEFVATEECMELEITKKAGDCQEPIFLSFGCQTCKAEAEPQSQGKLSNLAVFGGISSETLIKDIFIGGNCFDVMNVSDIGHPDGKGSFDSGAASIGINNGVILSSGSIYNAPGPNNSDSAGNMLTGSSNDPDLNQLTGGGLYDVVGIEFDFQPTINQITFEYVFASEEYCEWVGSQFNDVFGFFISGPGISGPFSNNGANIAVIPNTTTYVAINNVNHISNTNWFMPNQNNCGGITNMNDIQFDGYTVIMQATANVIPCETYHIRLVIADVGDPFYDSAVFLKANSFSAGGTAVGEVVVPSTGSNFVYEDCADGFITFTRVGGDINLPHIIELNLLPSSTATPGVDYAPLPTTVVIPAGQSSVTLPINVFPDGIPEGVETIVIGIENSCSCSSLEMELEIHDTPPMDALLDDVDLCQGTPLTLEPIVSGGVPPYTYQWSNGTQAPFLVAVPTQNTSYSVTVSDQCNQSMVATSNITVNEIPSATLEGSGFICTQGGSNPVPLSITFTGVGPWVFQYSIDGVVQTPITTMANPYQFVVTQPGIYEMYSVMTEVGNCEGPAIGVAPILPVEIENQMIVTPVTCQNSGEITAGPSGGVSPFNFIWSNNAPNAPTITGLDPGVYSVTISDQNGCTLVDSAEVTAAPPLELEAQVLTNVDCANPTGGSAEAIVNGGTPGYTYNWSGGIGNVQNPTGMGPGMYYVTVTDDQGCEEVDSVMITADTLPPQALADPAGVLNCVAAQVEVSGAGSSAGAGYAYQWSGPGIVGDPTGQDITVNQPGTYNLIVTNTANGCTATDDALVEQDLEAPVAVANGGLINCAAGQLELDGSGSSTGPNFAYQWTGPGIVSGDTTLNPIVNLAGNYELIVTNTANGCTESTLTLVEADSTFPTAAIATPAPLTCADTVVIVDGSGSSFGPGISYQWYFNGNLIPGANDPTYNASQPGTYEIEVFDNNNGCESIEAIDVLTDYAAPEMNPTVSGLITCVQSEVGLSANVNGDPANYTFQWTGPSIVAGANSANATVNEPGTYEVTATNLTNGCTATASIEVEQDADIPVPVINAPTELNCDIQTITLDGTASTQGPGITFTWTTTGGNIVSGANTLTPVVDQPGTYTLTIFDSNNNCESEESIDISQDIAQPDLSLPGPMTLTCTETSFTLTGNVSNMPAGDLSFEWSTTGGVVPPPGNTNEIIVTDPGTYTLLVTNVNNGCTAEQSVEISQDVTLPEATIANPETITCANNTVTLDGSGSSFGAGYDIQWSSTNGNFVSGTGGLNPVVNEPGTYNLLITNLANGCTEEASVVVDENTELPEANAGIAMTLTCEFPELTLQGSGSNGPEFEYQWTGPGIVSGGDTPTPVIDQPGTYDLLVTNLTNSCTATSSVTIDQDIQAPVADAGTTAELSCTLTSLTLDGSGSSSGPQYAYLWNTVNGNILSGEDTPAPTINAPGTYTLVVTNLNNGCTSESEVVITEDDDLPEVNIAQAAPITCMVDEVTLDGSASVSGPNFQYLWTTNNGNIVSGANTPNPVVNAPGTYLLTITNLQTSCSNSESVVVDDQTALPAVEAGTSDALTCAQTSLSLDGNGSAAGANYTYQWTGPGIVSGETSLTPVVNAPGTYQLLVTNTLTGCTNTDEVIVPEDVVLPSVNILTPSVLTCAITNIQLDAAGTSAGSEFNYQWSTLDGNIVSGGTTLEPVIDQPGTYELLVTNSINGCTSVESVTVDQDIEAPVADAGAGSTLSCAMPTFILDGSGSSSGGIFTYEWSTVNGSIVNSADTPTPTIDAPGTYQLLVTNTLNGCTSTDQVVIDLDNSLPTAIIQEPGKLTCAVTTIQLSANASQGNEFQYEWTTPNGNIVSGSTTLTPVVDQPGVYVLMVQNNQNGCAIKEQVEVEQDVALPVADAGQAFVLDCFESVNYLDGKVAGATGPINWQWTTTDGNIVSGADSPQPGINQPGTYLLTVTNTLNGCTDTDHVTITRDEPTAEPEVFQPPCYGDKGAIALGTVNGGTPPYVYSLDGGQTFDSYPIFTHLEPDVYPVVVQDANGCEYEQNVTIIQPTPLDLIVEPHVEIKLGESYQIHTQVTVPLDDITDITWFPSESLSCGDCLNPLATPTATTLYKLTVVTENGCEDSAPILIVVNKEASVYVPNAFSPNGDGTNDVFMIYADPASVAKIKSFLVFNRWGESVFQYFNFEPNNPAYGWDGMHRGQMMDPAVFAWFAEVEFIDGRTEIFKGDVTLMR
ncbi:MAG: hypothetical protein CMN32_15780 [Saprospirales bacterium]|nr:hypothetical protein [Saprospirales bacterium]